MKNNKYVIGPRHRPHTPQQHTREFAAYLATRLHDQTFALVAALCHVLDHEQKRHLALSDRQLRSRTDTGRGRHRRKTRATRQLSNKEKRAVEPMANLVCERDFKRRAVAARPRCTNRSRLRLRLRR